jgi:hypothetical protein
MSGLWGDGWFYISAVGFLVSSVLFVFLLGQYRSAVEASDEPEEGLPPMPLPLSSVPINVPVVPLHKPEKKPERTLVLPPAMPVPKPSPVPAPAPKPVPAPAVVTAPAPAAKPAPIPTPAAAPIAKPAAVAAAAVVPAAAPAPAPAPKPAPASEATQALNAPERRKSESTLSGQNSPAVAYLQNIKTQMEKFDKEIAGLKALSSQQAAQSEAIMRKLTELAEQMRGQSAPAALVAAPAPKPAPAAAEALASVLPAPAPAAKPAMTIERSAPALKAAPAPQEPPKPEVSRPVQPPAQKEEPQAEAPKRKGPVWPV